MASTFALNCRGMLAKSGLTLTMMPTSQQHGVWTGTWMAVMMRTSLAPSEITSLCLAVTEAQLMLWPAQRNWTITWSVLSARGLLIYDFAKHAPFDTQYAMPCTCQLNASSLIFLCKDTLFVSMLFTGTAYHSLVCRCTPLRLFVGITLCHPDVQVLDPREKSSKPFKKTLRSDLSGGPIQ